MNFFLADSGLNNIQQFIFPLVIISLSMSIPIVSIITEHLQKQKRTRLIEKAIEHGADLKDLNLDEPEPKSPRRPYRSGMILIAVGIALFGGHHLLDDSYGSIHVPLIVGGLITGCIGIAQLLNDWINRNRDHLQR